MEDWYEKNTDIARVRQGDIVSGVDYPIRKTISDKEERIEYITFPFLVVMTQECDLEQDYLNRTNKDYSSTQDKYLNSILLCPAYLTESLRSGKHLNDVNLTMDTKTGDLWRRVIGNNDKRYHRLPPSIDNSVEDITIDFKHFYTFNRDEFYEIHKKNYKISLKPIYREELSQRFAYYLSRIALPTPLPRYESVKESV